MGPAARAVTSVERGREIVTETVTAEETWSVAATTAMDPGTCGGGWIAVERPIKVEKT